jgi:REP element-mobilizing transposase RayT
LPYRVSYRRHLPHFQPAGATFHVVVKLDGAVPLSVVEALRQERDAALGHRPGQLAWQRSHFINMERDLDACTMGPRWLAESQIAALVRDAIHHRDGSDWDLIAYTIMPNHVHIVAIPGLASDGTPRALPDLLGSFKRYTATKANEMLKRRGAFWQQESYDRAIRDGDELRRTVLYVINNPVKAGLVDDGAVWAWTYVKGFDLRAGVAQSPTG